jgi:hypothetical protein
MGDLVFQQDEKPSAGIIGFLATIQGLQDFKLGRLGNVEESLTPTVARLRRNPIQPFSPCLLRLVGLQRFHCFLSSVEGDGQRTMLRQKVECRLANRRRMEDFQVNPFGDPEIVASASLVPSDSPRTKATSRLTAWNSTGEKN